MFKSFLIILMLLSCKTIKDKEITADISNIKNERTKQELVFGSFILNQRLCTKVLYKGCLNFNPLAKFSFENAFILSELAYASYFQESELRKLIFSWGFLGYRFIKRKNIEFFIAYAPSFAVIAFRGTEPDRLDIKIDTKLIRRNFYNGVVHGGFRDAYMLVRNDIIAIINELKSSGQKAPALWLTGHSLGAGLAELAAYDIILGMKFPITGLYTFGAPRAANNTITDYLTKNIYSNFRFVNNNDIITNLPAWEPGYRHTGIKVELKTINNTQCSYDIKKLNILNKITDAIKGSAILQILNLKSIPNHKLSGYMNCLYSLRNITF